MCKPSELPYILTTFTLPVGNSAENDRSNICMYKIWHSQVAGYLNLVANAFDNFTHGLAVAGSFIISPKIGVLTTTAILLHEIPHEIADFAILIRSGFNPWGAAKAQLLTALIGLLGAIFTLCVDCMQTMGKLCTKYMLRTLSRQSGKASPF